MINCLAPLFMELSRQEYWSGLLFPSPRALPDPRIEPWSLALQADSLPTEPLGKPIEMHKEVIYYVIDKAEGVHRKAALR